MSAGYWFHRNPFRSPAPVSFHYPGGLNHSDSARVCVSLKEARLAMIGRLVAGGVEEAELTEAFTDYVSLLLGFIRGTEESTRDGKLRFLQKFRWSETILNTSAVYQDAQYELCSILYNFALALSKIAARRAGGSDLSMEDAKLIHSDLKLASGYFLFIKDSLIPTLVSVPERGSDLDPNSLCACCEQSIGEAQEVTIARAIELNHDPGLIAGLCLGTAAVFKRADEALAKVKLEVFTKWRQYLQLKQKFYLSYAYSFHSDSLLASDRCGDAIRALQEAQKYHGEAAELCDAHRRSPGPGVGMKHSESPLFLRLGKKISLALEKSTRENGFIYFQKIPTEPPELDLKATFGMVEPPKVDLPPLNPLWTPQAEQGFDLGRLQTSEQKEQEIKILKEPDMKPIKDSRCSIA